MELVLDVSSYVLVLGLVAVGLAVIFSLLQVLNLAHGEFLMLGAYTVLLATKAGLSFWAAVTLAPLVLMVLGAMVEFLLIRRIAGRPLDSILATWGLAILLRQAVVLQFGPASQNVDAPTSAFVGIGDVAYPQYRLMVMAIAAGVLLAVGLLFSATRFGLHARAAIARPDIAAALGINVRQVAARCFVLGAGLAGLAGALLAPLISVDPNMGLGYLVPAFLAMLVGGGGSLFGVVAGAAVIGGADSLLGLYLSSVWAQIAVFVGAILLIRWRPAGLLRSRGERP
jgi:urea transport system permease protein